MTHKRRSTTPTPKGWHTRGYLPHADFAGINQFVTYHLADSVPSDVLIRRLEEQSPDKDREYRKRIEAFLDAGHGSCILQRPDIAEIIIKAWSYYDGERYDLQAWVVMPNHVHVLFTMRDHSMGSVLHSWKSYTANAIGKVTG